MSDALYAALLLACKFSKQCKPDETPKKIVDEVCDIFSDITDITVPETDRVAMAHILPAIRDNNGRSNKYLPIRGDDNG